MNKLAARDGRVELAGEIGGEGAPCPGMNPDREMPRHPIMASIER